MTDPKLYSDSFIAMNSHCDVVVCNETEEFAKAIFKRVKSEVEKLENRINRFYPDSPLAQLLNYETGHWISVSEEIWEPLSMCYDFYQISNGAFDISVAPLLDLWEEKQTPDAEEIQKISERCGMNQMEFDFDNRRVRFLKEGMELDFGGIQKGLALDSLKITLEEMGVKDCIVSFGEDAVLALGKHPNGSPWPLGVRNQMNPMEFVHVFAASNKILINSGAVEKTNVSEGLSKSYTISPATGEAIQNQLTVSIKSNSGLIASFISICWLILSDNDKAIVSENFKDMEILECKYLDQEVSTSLSIIN